MTDWIFAEDRTMTLPQEVEEALEDYSAPEPAGTPLGERDVSLCECGARLRGDVARSTGTCGACRPSPRSETTEDR